VINKLLEADFTNNNTDFSAETRKVLDKVFENEICLTHGNYAEKLMAKLHEITKLLSKDVHQKTALKKDNFGRIYEDIAAKEVGRQIIPQIAEKIAREENISKEKILPQLKQVNSARLSGSAEFDHTVLRIKEPPKINEKGQKIYDNFEVVGIVETKYDPALVAHGYDRRIEDLSWLTNKPEGFAKDKYHGEFNGKMVYDEGSDSYFNFSPSSFKRFNLDKNDRKSYENIYFVTSNSPLVALNEKIAEKIINSKNTECLKELVIHNEFDDTSRSIFEKYDKYQLWNNIVFTNDDYLGFSLLSFIIFHKVKDICKEKNINFPDYSKFTENQIKGTNLNLAA